MSVTAPRRDEPDPIACRWWLIRPTAALSSEVTVELRPQMNGEDLYAVLSRGCALSRSGRWDYEPTPSSRTPQYLSAHRFGSLSAAIEAWRRAPKEMP